MQCPDVDVETLVDVAQTMSEYTLQPITEDDLERLHDYLFDLQLTAALYSGICETKTIGVYWDADRNDWMLFKRNPLP